jgi:hypothetical protein
MINENQEFFSSPYYFFLKEKSDNFSLYFSVENTLTEARKKDKMIKIPKEKLEMVKKYLEKLVKQKKKKSSKEVGGEIDELVSSDGSFMNSKVPILDPRLHPQKTMDQTVAASRITNDPITRGYRTYYGESVEEEVKEEDMSGAFGYEETKELDGKETYKYFKDELDLEPEDAKDRTEQQGKDYTGKKDESSEFYDDPNFVMKGTIAEIQKQKAIKMLEDILMKKKNTDSSEVTKKQDRDIQKKQKEISKILKKNIDSLLRQMEKQGMSKKDLIKILTGE